MASAPVESLTLGDGTTMDITRVPGVDDATWGEVREYLEGNTDVAKSLMKFSKNPDAMRGWLQTQAIAEHYQTALSTSEGPAQERMKALEQDPELAGMFAEIKKNGLEAAMQFYQDEELMLKISAKMGGLPEELTPTMKKIDETPLNLHEAAKNGDLKRVQEYLDRKQPLDTQDHKGITPLGYAIGANRIAVVKLLLDSRANPYSVDSSGNSGLHYAAGYGRRELLEYLVKVGASVNQTNAQGQTPMTVAGLNKQAATIELLQAHGGK